MRLIDLTGKRFGRLVVIKRAPTVDKKTMWECQCDCGKKVICNSEYLRNGDTKSCGCLFRDIVSEKAKTHGMTNTKLYKKYRRMVYRCENPNAKSYKDYGGRGIKVCPEWRNDFLKFYEWCMSSGYQEGLTIDRIDNNGDYSPDNCRWATKIQQDNNRRNNKFISYNGETHTLAEWNRICGFTRGTIDGRLSKGWSVERAITTPIKRANRQGVLK